MYIRRRSPRRVIVEVTAEQAKEAAVLHKENPKLWTWNKLGERYGTDGYSVKLSVIYGTQIAACRSDAFCE